MKTRSIIESELEVKRSRLELYLKREAEMLDGGVQSYGIGSRNLARYNTDLSAIRAAIKEMCIRDRCYSVSCKRPPDESRTPDKRPGFDQPTTEQKPQGTEPSSAPRARRLFYALKGGDARAAQHHHHAGRKLPAPHGHGLSLIHI